MHLRTAQKPAGPGIEDLGGSQAISVQAAGLPAHHEHLAIGKECCALLPARDRHSAGGRKTACRGIVDLGAGLYLWIGEIATADAAHHQHFSVLELNGYVVAAGSMHTAGG